MEITFGQPVQVGGALCFPDPTFANKPVTVGATVVQAGGAPSQVISLPGSAAGVYDPADVIVAP